MSIPILDILQRLKLENLTYINTPQRATEFTELTRQTTFENQDLDSSDPRWIELFMEFFVDPTHEVSDDILFFVRLNNQTSANLTEELDAVIVKRRVAGQTPTFTEPIDWKQSFFLNLISQVPCTLTVAICQKNDESNKTLVKRPSEIEEDRSGSSASLNTSKSKSPMITSRRITKKVYASPYKSRMDVKDALMNECSFPVVYYTINDYDSESLHLTIRSGEYLCVELSVTLPAILNSQEYIGATQKVADITVAEDSDPFPLPTGYSKIILFQGAVSFKALSDVYQQKGLIAANQSRNGWGRKPEVFEEASRTEYVLMRGPHAKGQCQVAIQEPNPVIAKPPNTLFGILKAQLRGDEESVEFPESLDCSMTYVSSPWQSISSDLNHHTV